MVAVAQGWSQRLKVWSEGLSEGCWFDSPGLHVQESLGKILSPKPCMLHDSICHQCMNYCKSSNKCPKHAKMYYMKLQLPKNAFVLFVFLNELAERSGCAA